MGCKIVGPVGVPKDNRLGVHSRIHVTREQEEITSECVSGSLLDLVVMLKVDIRRREWAKVNTQSVITLNACATGPNQYDETDKKRMYLIYNLI